MLTLLLLRPTGWPTAILLLVAVGLLVSATRWPHGVQLLRAVDLSYYLNNPILLKSGNATDSAYLGGLFLFCLVILYWITRTLLRVMLRQLYGQPPAPPVNLGRRFVLATFAICALGGSVVVGWPYRIARMWIQRILAMPPRPTTWFGNTTLPAPPIPLDTIQTLLVLKSAVMQLPTRTERIAALKLLFEEHKEASLPILYEAIAHERDPQVRATEVRLIGVQQDIKSLQPLLSLWNDPDAEVRAAVTDAIGLLHAPAYPIPNAMFCNLRPSLNTIPPISIPNSEEVLSTNNGPVWSVGQPSWAEGEKEKVESLRGAIERRLTQSVTVSERTAAARALLKWQNSYRLRVAEWGVWIVSNGNFHLAQSIIDEIPPFVHRTGDALSSLATRVVDDPFVEITKPILHFTSDRPMAVDVQVMIRDGRPWFAFPEPDDYTLKASLVNPYAPRTGLPRFDNAQLPPLREPREGYPWLDPAHNEVVIEPVGWAARLEIESLGLRWQSVIVSPEKLSWMSPPTVPRDSKFDWWNRLREVPCSWVSNRGESERFLYYDGPANALPSMLATLDGKTLTIKRGPKGETQLDPTHSVSSFVSINATFNGFDAWRKCSGMYVMVDAGSRNAEGFTFDASEPIWVDLTKQKMVAGDALIDELKGMLTRAGLNDAEADGLIDCWRGQFFATPGSRFIMLMSPMEYDELCPIRIDPAPTELVRVGLVLTEFGVAG